MQELREIADAYLAVAPKEIKEEAEKFYKKMERDSNGRVFLTEFLKFTDRDPYKEFSKEKFFKQLCRGERKYLSYVDVMTFYYIIRSRRTFCKGCKKFLEGVYFCCIQCFHTSKTNYCLCTGCLKTKEVKRDSDHNHQFLDNFTFLDIKKKEALKAEQEKKKKAEQEKKKKAATAPTSTKDSSLALVPAAKGSGSRAIVPAKQQAKKAETTGSSSRAIVPAKRQPKKGNNEEMKAFLGAVVKGAKVAAAVAHAAAAVAAVGQIIACVIM